MNVLKCPTCDKSLSIEGNTYKCALGHSFDCAKRGYVNLLLSQKSKMKQHGDDKAMVKARHDFLEKGYYKSLAIAIQEILDEYESRYCVDAGCGEGWYTQFFTTPSRKLIGVDISKNAVDEAGKRKMNAILVTASTYELPIMDGSMDSLVSIFAPYSELEINRVIKEGGIAIIAYPLHDHLHELKEIVYEATHENDNVAPTFENFECKEIREVRDMIYLENNGDIMNLFQMTPYAHRTPQTGVDALSKVDMLEVRCAFGVAVYQKN